MNPTLTATKTAEALAALPLRLRDSVKDYGDRLDLELIAHAYRYSEQAHAGQKRASGEEYIAHCVEVSKIVTDLHLDTTSIVAALVHDVVEDTLISLEDLRAELGEEIANIVDGVTKIGKVTFSSNTEQQVENYRKLLLSMAHDARVIVIKLADRLHNMRTL
jgi:guanosine-3',5'-bis(diphosphate) 3'-pyrophosphohydrolase